MHFRLTLALLIFILSGRIYCQNRTISGTVSDSLSREPLAFVNISWDESGRGAVSSIDGRFHLKIPESANEILFSFVGYTPRKFSATSLLSLKNANIALQPRAYDLKEVYVYPGENPANRIIARASEYRKSNNPEKISSFSYICYDKMFFTIAADSVSESVKSKSGRIDNKEMRGSQGKNISDTAIHALVDKQYLLIMESISSREFIYLDKDKEKILASRVSGFKKPSFILMARQFQSFSFYDDFITISEKKYLNPIAPGSSVMYFFLLEDTMYTARNDTVFIISFRPKSGKNFEGLKGVLYINSHKWAIQNVIAEASNPQYELISIKIQQKYDLVNDHWFPVQLNTNMTINGVKAGSGAQNMTVVGKGKSYLMNIRINPGLTKKEFDDTYIEVNKKAHQMPESYWQNYRVDSLSPKDMATYRTIDSIGKANHFDRTFNNMETLMTGFIPGRYLNLDLRSLIGYNTYEGWRLGIGGTTNNNFSPLFDIGGHIAYGFGDKAWKYGASLNIHPFPDKDLYLRLSYLNELEETGGVDFLESQKLLSSESFRKYMVENMDRIQRKQAGIGMKMFRYLNLFLFFRTTVNTSTNTYLYSITNENPRFLIDEFNYTEAGIMTRYAFKEGFMQTPAGNRFSLGTKSPVFYLNVTKGLLWLNGRFNFIRAEAKITKIFTTRRLGDSKIRILGGMVTGNVPYSRLYAGRGSYKSFGVDAEYSFATMRFNEFLSDRYVSLYFKQDFGRLLFHTTWFHPGIAVVNNIGFGWLDNKSYHNNIDFKTLEKGYFECGLLINNLISQKLFGYGLGLYYRYGPYSFLKTKNNLALKLTFSSNL